MTPEEILAELRAKRQAIAALNLESRALRDQYNAAALAEIAALQATREERIAAAQAISLEVGDIDRQIRELQRSLIK